jgi:alcohol dehydrogenase class IV
MRTISFLQPKRLVFGSGCLQDCVDYLVSQPQQRIHLVGSRSLREKVHELGSALEANNCTVSSDLSIDSEPTLAMFKAALEKARIVGANCFVGIGGGSVLDVAKLLATFANRDQCVEDTFGIGLVADRTSHLVCIPTTAGTGSEVSPNAILLDETAKLKKGVISPFLVPDATFIDPLLTLTVPPGVTAATGLDTLTHCIEAYTNKFAHPLIDLYAIEGIRLCASYLIRAIRDGNDVEAREGMSRASLYGGLCLGPVNTAAVHALAYPLGGEFHIAHGISNAVLLPAVFRFNIEAARERHATVALALGVEVGQTDRKTAFAGAERLRELVAECGLSTNLARYGLSLDMVPHLAASAATVTRLLRNNPRELSLADIEELYRQSFDESLAED